MPNKTRIYGDTADINDQKVKSFFNKRATLNNLNAVLLGNQKDSEHSDLRNEKEYSLLKYYFNDLKNFSVLDIGCGMGRWANNLKDEIKLYHGIDFSENFITSNKKRFKSYENINFMVMSATNIDLSKLNITYDLIIISGVLMYINDKQINGIFNNIKKLNPRYIYLQESISILNDGLTLKDFYSKELDTQYNAIYRTKEEYEFYVQNILSEYEIQDSSLLLDKETGAREETNAQYWFIKNSENTHGCKRERERVIPLFAKNNKVA